jgi:hypothetical protein
MGFNFYFGTKVQIGPDVAQKCISIGPLRHLPVARWKSSTGATRPECVHHARAVPGLAAVRPSALGSSSAEAELLPILSTPSLTPALSLAHRRAWLVKMEPPWMPPQKLHGRRVPAAQSHYRRSHMYYCLRLVVLRPARTLARALGHQGTPSPWPPGQAPRPPSLHRFWPPSTRTDRAITFPVPRPRS